MKAEIAELVSVQIVRFRVLAKLVFEIRTTHVPLAIVFVFRNSGVIKKIQ